MSKTALAVAVASTALLATPGLSVRPRGLLAVRNETDPAKILAQINVAFEEFKVSNDNRIKELEKKQTADVLNVEQVNRINAEITDLKKMFDEAQKVMAAIRVGGIANDEVTPEKKAHAAAFNKWFRRGDRAIAEDALKDLAVKAKLTTDSDTDGGYVVPDEMTKTIDRVLGTMSAMRQLAQVIPIGTSVFKKPINQGGATAGWVGEREARSETNTPQLNLLEFAAMELYALPYATQTMLDDAFFNAEQWLADEVAIAFAEQEGAAYVTGSGVNRPRGLLSYDTIANASYAWGKIGFIATGSGSGFITPTTTASPADCLISLMYALKQGYRANATWLMSDATMGTVRQLKDVDGKYLWAPPTSPEGVPTILGKSTATDDNMQSIGSNAFPIAFGDFRRGYLIVDRFGVRVLRDPYTNKPYIGFYTTKRVGGGIQNFEAIKLLKCA